MFEQELSELRISIGFKQLIAAIFLLSFFAASAALLWLDQRLVAAAILVLPCLLAYFFLEFMRERRKSKLDASIPAALFQASAFSGKTSLEKVLESIAESDSPFSSECRKILNMVGSGASVSKAVRAAIAETDSALLKRTLSLLLEGHESGADLRDSLKEIAEDVLETQAVYRENAASLSIQKYTLLLGGGILVPFILGTLLNVFSGLETSFSQSEGTQIIETIVFANQAYLAIFAALASYFIALQEGRRAKSVLYFCLLAPLSLLLFNFAKQISLF